MEILIILALAYGIMRSIHHGVVNTAALVRGREPVYVPRHRPVSAGTGDGGGPGVGTAVTAAVAGGVGRGGAAVTAGVGSALIDGLRAGWGEGRDWYAKRKKAKAARSRDAEQGREVEERHAVTDR